eukprot:TRINITY_DN1797_c0_g1_i1.p1 TRINITY_DN1797_c0_g1~~TRINITY_DN1797_c0_g1_i1.p1  ORF type:complete len:702 (+),score=131.26 TRINITY_DN1797_c0_g1_i1:52-2157(+)
MAASRKSANLFSSLVGLTSLGITSASPSSAPTATLGSATPNNPTAASDDAIYVPESGEVIIPKDVTHSATGSVPSNELIISTSGSSAATYDSAMDRIKDDITPGSRKMDGSANVGSLLRLFNSQFFDLWLAITYLFKFMNPGVVDYLANRLFDYPEEEIEFYIPQLCNLMIIRSSTNALEHFMLNRCSKSIHFAIKVSLYINANMPDFRAGERARAAEKLIDKVESVAVNNRFSPVPNSSAWSVTITDRTSLSLDKPLSVPTITRSTSQLSINSDGAQSDSSTGATPLSPLTRAVSASVLTTHASPKKGWIPISRDPAATQDATEIAFEDPGDPFSNPDIAYSSVDSSRKIGIEVTMVVDGVGATHSSSLTTPIESPILSNRSLDAATSQATKLDLSGDIARDLEAEAHRSGLEFHRSKGARSDYFNRVETFLAQLNGISDSLRAEPIERRNELLQVKLRLLNADLPAPVYVPLYTGSDLHHAVLRIPAEEAFTLKSKERVPFMLIVEVLESNNKSCNPDLSLPLIPSRTIKSTTNEPLTRHPGPFGELKDERETRLRRYSPYGHLPTWKTFCCIVKSGDDIRQDQFALQVIEQFQRIFRNANIPLWLYTYRTLVTSSNSGFIEVVPDAISIDSLKKKIPNFTNLAAYFDNAYAGTDKRQKLSVQEAKLNFVQSMAAYSLVSYFLQIKDRFVKLDCPHTNH